MGIIQQLWLRASRLAAAAIGRFARYFNLGKQLDYTSEYVYTPLNASRKEIRLCSINPGLDGDVVEIKLRTVCFEDWKGRYSCISYAWGSLERTKPVFINGRLYTTTGNLWVVLQRLRTLAICNNVWIDALCIDQNDVERSYQVGMMGEIFQAAREVYIGIETEPATRLAPSPTLAADVLHGLVENRHLNDLTLSGFPKATLRDKLESFHQLLNSQWFTRAWTVQEVCLARRTTFLCAAGCISWTTVASAFFNWNEHRKGCCASIAASLDDDSCLRTWLYQTYSHIQSINATVTALSTGQHIIKSLLYYQNMKASKPVDKYFAFRGLHTHQSSIPLPLPDYHHTKERVFTDLSRWLLQDQQSLSVLCIDLPDKDQRCPSWVPDWSAESSMNAIYRRMRLALLESYDAARNLPVELSFTHSDSLKLRGICIGRVDCVSTDRFELDSTQNNQRVLDAWSKVTAKSTCPAISENDFFTTMLGGRILERGKPVREAQIADAMELKRQMVSESIEPSAYHTPVMRSHIAAVLERRFFRLEDDKFGLGPDLIVPGDEIWVLTGGSAPFALRRFTDLEHKLVGHCYVSNIMKGEAVEKGYLESCTLV